MTRGLRTIVAPACLRHNTALGVVCSRSPGLDRFKHVLRHLNFPACCPHHWSCLVCLGFFTACIFGAGSLKVCCHCVRFVFWKACHPMSFHWVSMYVIPCLSTGCPCMSSMSFHWMSMYVIHVFPLDVHCWPLRENCTALWVKVPPWLEILLWTYVPALLGRLRWICRASCS